MGYTNSYESLPIAKLMVRRQYQHATLGGVYTIVGIAVATFAGESKVACLCGDITFPVSLKDILYNI
jgi:hypothetical protein